MNQLKPAFVRYLAALAWVYFTGLFGWLGAYLLTGDHFGYLALVNSLAFYLFFLLPIILLIALYTRRRSVWTGFTLGVVAFAGLWGGAFIPRTPPAQAGTESLSVMTYNVLGLHTETEAALLVLRAENAEVVLLQEVNSQLANALQQELADLYPYQFLIPQDGVRGMGLLSKFPFTVVEGKIPLDWVGPPQVAVLDWNNRPVALVNFHMWSVGVGPEPYMSQSFREREKQAQALADFAAQTDIPLIIAGDANATPLSWTYKILQSGGLRDAWEEKGWGLGHTFPGRDLEGDAHPHVGSIPIPSWLVRIDYVFVSPAWEIHTAQLAQFDGASDHRGVKAVLSLNP